MKLAIILILGMVSCFEIGQAADGASDIRKLLSRTQRSIDDLTNDWHKQFTIAASELNKTITISIKNVDDILRLGLDMIQSVINFRPVELRGRCQHCLTHAKYELESPQSDALQRFKERFDIEQSTINATKPNLLIKEGQTLITELEAYLGNPTTDNIQKARQDVASFTKEAARARYKLPGLFKSVPENSESEEFSREVLADLGRQVEHVIERGIDCVVLINEDEE